jgi:tetratricopeptide (TPR) repeat protein
MKSSKTHILIVIVILFISTFSNAQNIDNDEERELKFQQFFFEALKQKAIKNYKKAIVSLENSYQLDSTNTAVEFEFSKNYLFLKSYFEAELFINKALLKEPTNLYLLTHKVNILKEQQKFNEAIEIQKKIVLLNPKKSEKLVLLYIQNNEFEKATKLIVEIEEKAIQSKRIEGLKKFLNKRNELGKTTTSKIDVVSKSESIESLKKQYDTRKEYALLIKILSEQKKQQLFNELYNDSKKALELFPAQPYLYKINGLALNKLGKYSEAIAVLTLGIDFVIDDYHIEADFYEQLSISYNGLNNKQQALKYQKKATELRNRN